MEGHEERENRTTLKEARFILRSRTQDAAAFREIVHALYRDHIKRKPGNKFDAAPPLPEEKPKYGDLLDMMKEANKKLEKMTRNLYEEQTGQKWRPALRVIEGGGNTTPITRVVTRHNKPLS